MLVQISDASLSFGEKQILSHIYMEIKGEEKIGIVGPNGTGKSSLLKVIAGEQTLDRDDKRQGPGIRLSRQIKIAKLSQDNSRWLEDTVEEILLEGLFDKEEQYSEERFHYEQRYDKCLQDFGFLVEDKQKRLKEFSGGEQTKLMLVKLLLTEADLLLLDEPTNHLDEESVEALEEYLSAYRGAVVVVSHDRYFLDQVAEVIYELEDTRLTKYDGNYTAYRTEKRKRYERQLKAYEQQQEEIARNEQLIKQFKNKPKKAAFARARKSMLDRMERIEKPKSDLGHIFTGELTPEYPGPKWMLQMEKLIIGYDKSQQLLEPMDLRIRRGQKIGILGKNGIGKSTLLKTLIGEITPVKGRYQFGEKVTIGYFDQSSGQIQSEEKVVDYFKQKFPGMLEKEVYGRLAAFLFKGELCQHRISSLSGGEKARLRICELLTLCPNFLILDEPTNHMDIQAKETLESAFRSYKGTLLFVSHDRYFLDKVADAMLVLDEKKAYYYAFGYSHYAQKKRKMEELLAKGVSLDDLPGILSTQDQAMIASLKAVPKGQSIAGRQLSDDEAYLDWKLRLAAEPMEEARKKAEELYIELNEAEEQYRICLLMALCQPCEEDAKMRLDQINKLHEAYELAALEWTRTCLAWYDAGLPEEDI